MLDDAVCASGFVCVSSIVSSLYNISKEAPTYVTLFYLTSEFLCQHRNRSRGPKTVGERESDNKRQ